MVLEFVVSLLLVALTVLIHYEVLRLASLSLGWVSIAPRARILVVIFYAFIAHLMEVALFAATFFLLIEEWGIGALAGNRQGGFYDYLYFSLSSYTSLGLGDIYLQDALRFLSGVEALIGLMMITWTASFTYLAMEKFWDINGTANKRSSR
ncbi:MAG: ion channel [Gammaproteobacteria bacterium]